MTLDPPVRLPPRQADAHKGKFGRLMLVGGSRGMSGSIALSAIAALRVGAGLVTAAIPERCLETVAAFNPCIMTYPLSDDAEGRFALDAANEFKVVASAASAIGSGPGMTTGPGSIRMVERLLQSPLPRVFDADAINVLSLLDVVDRQNPPATMILTPHPGEFARLTGVSASDHQAQISAAREWCDERGAIIVLKGGPTVVMGPAQDIWTNPTGNPGMATAGSGDVLTGVISSFLAQGLSTWDSARLGVWVHGLAGDLAAEQHGQVGMTAVEICGCLPQAMQTVSMESRVTA